MCPDLRFADTITAQFAAPWLGRELSGNGLAFPSSAYVSARLGCFYQSPDKRAASTAKAFARNVEKQPFQ
jgi:hypothetical protein